MLSLLFKDVKESFQNQNDNLNTTNENLPEKNNKMEIELAMYVTLIIASTLAFIKFKPDLDNSFFRNTYKLYYSIFLFNLLNLSWFTFYYNYKIKQLTGRIGDPGEVGSKGVRGEFITCSFCDYNLYIQKTKRYNKIVTLSLGLFKNNLNNSNEIKSTIDIVKNFGINGYGVDMREFNLDILKNPDKLNNGFLNELNTIFDPLTRMNYLSHYLTRIILKSGYTDKISFFRPIGGNGYYPIGFSVFKSETANKSYAFLINGDIRLPVGYEPKFTFRNDEQIIANLQEDGSILTNQNYYYTFMKPVPPKEYEIIQDTNILTRNSNQIVNEDLDSTSNVSLVKYVSMGEIIIRTEGEDIEALKENKVLDDNINHSACIKESCARKIKYNELELMGIKISYDTQNNKVNEIINYMNSTSTNKIYKNTYTEVLDKLDVYAIWKTPMNTFVTNCFIGTNNITNGSVSYNIVNGNKDLLSKSKLKLNKRGKFYVNKLKKIKLPRVIRIVYIMIYQYNQYFDSIVSKCKDIIVLFEKEITKIRENVDTENNTRTKKQKATDNKKIADMNRNSEILEQLVTTLGDTEYRDGQKVRQELYNNFSENISNILDKDKMDYLETKLPKYKNIKDKLNQIPFLIDANITLYDILMLFFDNDLEQFVAIDERGINQGGRLLTNTQKEILKLCAVCMPPNLDKEPVYMPSNSCLSFENISLSRQKLAFKFNKVISEVDRLFEIYRLNPKLCSNFKTIQEERRFMDDKLSRTLSQIPDYYKKIKERDIEKFTDGRLKFIINQYQNLLNIMKNGCAEKMDVN